MKNKQFLVYHPSQLNSLSTWPIVRTPGIGRIVLDQKFQHPNKETWEKGLNRDYYACGCDTGAKALVAGLIGCLAIAAMGYLDGRISVGKAVLVGLVGPLILAGIGKLYGLAKANGRLKKTIREIQSNWKTDLPTAEELIACG
jgi:hypothetical protein